MPQVTLRINLVAHPLLEHLGLREPAIGLALPDLYTVARNAKRPAGRRLQRHLAEVIGKGAQQFLGQPRSAQQPLALGAIGDDNLRLGSGHEMTDSCMTGQVNRMAIIPAFIVQPRD